MGMLHEILKYNQEFVELGKYKQYQTTKFPNKKAVILTCMDTRLVELLPKSMKIKNGDVKIVKNAGAIVTHPFGSIMRSIIVAVYELQADEVMVIGHHDCGMSAIQSDKVIAKMEERGIKRETIDTLLYSGIDIDKWLKGFSCVEDNVRNSVKMIKNHPLMAKGIPVHGLVIDPNTGKLDLIVNGYER
jgi:carbonic anhydrase